MNFIPALPGKMKDITIYRKKEAGDIKHYPGMGYTQIKHMLSGSVTYTVSDNKRTMYPGETVVINPYEDYTVEIGEDAEFYSFLFDSYKHFDTAGIPALTRFENFIEKNETISYICHAINYEYENQPSFHENMLISLTDQLLIHLYRNYSKSSVGTPSSQLLGKHKIARLALEYIYKNCQHGVTTSEISTSINVSTSHLCRCFKEATGVSVMEYAERIRCRKAKEDLSLGTFSVTQIAEKYHFNSLSYFNRRYKKYCGENPAKTLAKAKKLRSADVK
ncbi:MAG: helix-turn-helix domain-containing protein [Clostridia bacterium]|nr:helix-turn-helix domain-containing protein [Clostridia bacterium]